MALAGSFGARAIPPIENVPPRVVIATPNSAQIHQEGDTVAISGTALDADGYVGHFEFWVDGVKIGEETINYIQPPPPGEVQQFKWPWVNSTAGRHRATVTATDDRGALGKAEVEFVVLDTNPLLPLVSIDAPRPSTGEPCPTCRIAPGVLNVRRTGPALLPLNVWIGYRGTAVPGLDYQELPGLVQIPAGESSVDIHVGAKDDLLVEGEETVVAVLIQPLTDALPQYRIDADHDTATVVIHDDDQGDGAVVSIAAGRAETSEPACNPELCDAPTPAPATFIVKRTGAKPAGELTVNYEISGTAENGVDYGKLSGEVTFPAGTDSVEIPVAAAWDLVLEGDESVVLRLVGRPDATGLTPYRIAADGEVAKVVIHDRNRVEVPTVGLEVTLAETREPFLCKTKPCPLMPEPAPARFTLHRKGGDLKAPLTVYLGYGGTAANGVDYAPMDGTVVIPAGEDRLDLWVAALPDEVVEGDETVLVNILIPPGLPDVPPPYFVDNGSARMVIHDATPVLVPMVSIEATQPETSEPCPVCLVLPGVYTVSRLGDISGPLTVFLGYDGSARGGVDYVKLPESVIIPAGKTSVEVRVVALADGVVEGVESVVANLLPDPSAGPLARYQIDPKRTSAKIAIRDWPAGPDSPVVSVEASSTKVVECPPGLACDLASVTLKFQRQTAQLDQPLIVHLEWSGSAIWGSDYGIDGFKELPSQIEFKPGSDTTVLSLSAYSDCVIEGAESVAVTILPDPSKRLPPLYQVSPTQGGVKVAILDGSLTADAPGPVVGISSPGSAPEFCPPNADCLPLMLSLSRAGGDLKAPLTVQLSYSGTATAGKDYTELPQTVTFQPGETRVLVTGGVIDDALAEGSETVVATLVCSDAAIPGYQIDGAHSSTTVVLLDDDAVVKSAVVEIRTPANGATFVEPASIQFVARAVDPAGAITKLQWFDGATKIGDSEIVFIREPDPGTPIVHEFSWPAPGAGAHKVYAVGVDAGGKPVRSEAVLITVVRKDARPVVSVTAGVFETTEVPPGSRRAVIPATFVLKRSGDLSRPLQAHYSVGGTAKNGRDYGLLDGDATFVAGEAERVIEVFPITDELVEGDETVELVLRPWDTYVVGQPNAAKLVIHDAQQPVEPRVVLTSPAEGGRVGLGAEVSLVAMTVHPGGYFGQVDFLANGKVIGSEYLIICAGLGCEPAPGTAIPFKHGWKPAEPGAYILTAAAIDARGLRVESAPIRIEVVESAPSGFVVRGLPGSYFAGKPVEVTLKAAPPAQSGSYGIEDHPPKGWVVGAISGGGSWDPVHGAVKFGPFLDAEPRSLRYIVTPPDTAVGNVAFKGVASFNGTSSPIGGASVMTDAGGLHPADRSPADWSLNLDEVTAYGATWRTGGKWPVAPNPIPIDYVTRAGALWRGGEAYLLDPSAGRAPVWWVNPTSAGPRPTELNLDLPPDQLASNLDAVRVRRSFAAAEVVPAPEGGYNLLVRLMPGDGVRAYAVEMAFDPKAGLSGASDGAVVDADLGVVRWGPFYDGENRTLTARLGSGPAGAVLLKGVASFDGESTVLGLVELAGAAPGKVAPPRIAGTQKLADGSMQLFVIDDSGAGCEVEFSDDLHQWHRMGTMPAAVGCQVHQDSDANESRQRFYRVVRLP